MSEANHNLIRLLNKPGFVCDACIYKEISFFELGAGSESSGSVLFSRRTSALTCKQASIIMIIYSITVFPPCYVSELQALAIKKNYPVSHAGLRNSRITMGDLQ